MYLKETNLFLWSQPAATYSSMEQLTVSCPTLQVLNLTVLFHSQSESLGEAISL